MRDVHDHFHVMPDQQDLDAESGAHFLQKFRKLDRFRAIQAGGSRFAEAAIWGRYTSKRVISRRRWWP